jgi:hypothetical protein
MYDPGGLGSSRPSGPGYGHLGPSPALIAGLMPSATSPEWNHGTMAGPAAPVGGLSMTQEQMRTGQSSGIPGDILKIQVS